MALEYTIVQDQSSTSFVAAMNEALQGGWQMSGTLCIHSWTYDSPDGHISEWWYVQAMTRQVPEGPPDPDPNPEKK